MKAPSRNQLSFVQARITRTTRSSESCLNAFEVARQSSKRPAEEGHLDIARKGRRDGSAPALQPLEVLSGAQLAPAVTQASDQIRQLQLPSCAACARTR